MPSNEVSISVEQQAAGLLLREGAQVVKYSFYTYKIVFNDHLFKGDGYLLPLPRKADDMYGGRVMVCSRPPRTSYTWLLNLTRRVGLEINGTVMLSDGSTVNLSRGALVKYATGPNAEGLYAFTFAFETIDPPFN